MRRPLWVISGHFAARQPGPLYPRKRTLLARLGMSAKCQKQTLPERKKICNHPDVRTRRFLARRVQT
jgi:hypothetical protein